MASIEDLVAFKQLFSSSVRKKLTSDHLWLSVFSRPTRSSFTRVQRISCCMSLLFLTMITNAMWFKSDGEADQQSNKQVVAMSIGPFSFTLSQVTGGRILQRKTRCRLTFGCPSRIISFFLFETCIHGLWYM